MNTNYPPQPSPDDDWEEPGDAFAPDDEDIAAWKTIASHLETHEPVALPQGFRSEVLAAVARNQRRRDLVLMVQVGCVTALLVTAVVAYALGVNWWQRLAAWLKPETLTLLADSLIRAIGSGANSLAPLLVSGKPLLTLLPWLLLVASLFAVLVEFAVFHFLRVGPFRRAASSKIIL